MEVNENEACRKLNIAVIGAGVAGLASAKQSLARGYNVKVFEQECELGGIWYYTDEIGKNKFGQSIHTSSYKDLKYILLQMQIFSFHFSLDSLNFISHSLIKFRTNAPYQLMEYSGFHYPNEVVNRKISVIMQSDVLKYMHLFADHFDLKSILNSVI